MQRSKAQPAKGFLAVSRISQQDAAAAIGCHPAHLCAVLNGDRQASEELKEKLAHFLGKPVGVLFREVTRCSCGRGRIA